MGKRILWNTIALHILFWIFIFAAVNVDWRQNWFDASIRPDTPAPLSVILFPILFYAHAYWALPSFLSTRHWLIYVLRLGLLFLLPELLRLAGYAMFLDKPLEAELYSRDSFLFGGPSPVWMAFITSILFRLAKDRFEQKTASQTLLDEAEARRIGDALERVMRDEKPYLNPSLDLDSLAAQLSITDKKLSTLLNQHIKTSFPDYVNAFRVRYFIEQVETGKLKHLSVVGLADQCGFSSKTTFYRAFKKVKGCTPTEFVVSNHLMELPSQA